MTNKIHRCPYCRLGVATRCPYCTSSIGYGGQPRGRNLLFFKIIMFAVTVLIMYMIAASVIEVLMRPIV